MRFFALLVGLLIVSGRTCAVGWFQDGPLPSDPAQQLTPFQNSAFALTLDRQLSRIAIGGYRGEVVVYGSQSLDEKFRIEPAGGMVLALSFDPSSKHLLVLGDPKRLRIYDTNTWRLERTIDLPFRCGFLSCHPKHPVVALAGTGPEVLFINIKTGAVIGKMNQKLERAFDLAFTADGSQLLAVAKTKGVTISPHNVIAINTASLLEDSFKTASPAFRVVANSPLGFQNLATSPDHSHFAVVDKGGRVLLLDNDQLTIQESFSGNFTEGRGLTFLDNDRMMASNGRSFSIFDRPASDSPRQIETEHAQNSNHLIYDAVQRRLFASHARARNQLTVWEFGSRSLNEKMAMAKSPDSMPVHSPVDAPTENKAPVGTKAQVASDSLKQQSIAAIEHSSLFLQQQLAPRVWTDAKSQRTLLANLIGMDGNDVLVRLENADEVIIDRRRLAAEDQEFLSKIDTSFTPITSFDPYADDPIASGLCKLLSVEVWADDVPPASDGAESETGRRLRAGGLPNLNRQHLTVQASAVDRRGGFYVATNVGLGKYDPDEGTLVCVAGPPQLERTMMPSASASIEELVVDRFGRALVRFRDSWQIFRWNGFEWTHLWTDLEGGLQSLVIQQREIYSLVKEQPFPSIAQLHEPVSHLLRLNSEDRWEPLPVRIDGQPISGLVRLIPFGDDNLLGIRSNDSPVVISGQSGERLDIPELAQNATEWVNATNVGPAISPVGAIYFLRVPDGPSSYGRTEIKRVSGESSRLWQTDAKFYEADQPRGIGSDHLQRTIVWYRNQRVFYLADDDELKEFTPVRKINVSWNSPIPESSPLREQGVMTRALKPFVHDRLWTAKDGNQVTASCVAINNTHVKLKKASGGTVAIPRDILDGRDQNFLSNLEWHQGLSKPPVGKLQVISQHRTRSGTFQGWNDMPEEEKAKILPRILAASLSTNSDGTRRYVLATTEGLQVWDGGHLTMLTRGPSEVITSPPDQPPQCKQLASLPNGGVLATFMNDQRVFYWDGNEWSATHQTDELRLLHLTEIGDTVCAISLQRINQDTNEFGIAQYDPRDGWNVFSRIRIASEPNIQITVQRLLPVKPNRVAVVWLVQDDRKAVGGHPGLTKFTFHEIGRREQNTESLLESAASRKGAFAGPGIVAHGLIMLRSTKPPFRLFRWCDGAPFESAITSSPQWIRELATADNFAMEPDGALWIIDSGRVTRASSEGMLTVDIKDNIAGKIEVDDQGTAYVRGDYLTVVKFVSDVDSANQ